MVQRAGHRAINADILVGLTLARLAAPTVNNQIERARQPARSS